MAIISNNDDKIKYKNGYVYYESHTTTSAKIYIGKDHVKIDTYGSKKRKYPNSVSQSMVFEKSTLEYILQQMNNT